MSNNSTNILNNWTKELFSIYMEAVQDFYAVDDLISFWTSVIITSTFILGLFGYFLELIVLRNPEFQDHGYLYHKILAVCEILLLVTFPMMSANGFKSIKEQSHLSVYMAKVANPAFSNFLAITIYTVIAGMAFNRYIAIMKPMTFKAINTPKYPYSFLVAGLIQGFIGLLYLLIFDVEFNTDCECYRRITTSFFPTFYKVMFIAGITFEAINSVATGFFTVQIIWGFARKSKTKILNESQHSLKSAEERAKTFQLTILCLACSIPFLASFILAVVPFFFPDFVVGPDALGLTFEEANKQLQIAYAYSIFSSVHEFLYDFTHSTHFYMYLVLNQRFRIAAKQQLLKIFCGRLIH